MPLRRARTRGVFYRKRSGRAKLGLRVFSERARQPIGSKAAIARRSPPERDQNCEPAAIHQGSIMQPLPKTHSSQLTLGKQLACAQPELARHVALVRRRSGTCRGRSATPRNVAGGYGGMDVARRGGLLCRSRMRRARNWLRTSTERPL
jgi:hypothetical protein